MSTKRINSQKKIAMINDFTGFGRCSITVSLPIISQLGIQCNPIPTAIFSNHTGFPSYYWSDYTENMPAYIEEWKKMQLHFDGILSGFLGSLEQMEIVKDFIRHFRDEDTCVVIDPVMGDNGCSYTTYTQPMCEAMRELVRYADILTPNLTEACILTEREYAPEKMKLSDYYEMTDELAALMESKNRRVVISGVRRGCYVANIIRTEDGNHSVVKALRVGHERAGTGDVYVSVIAADAVQGVPFVESVRRASDFVKKCIAVTEQYNVPSAEGVCFEELLHTLKRG